MSGGELGFQRPGPGSIEAKFLGDAALERSILPPSDDGQSSEYECPGPTGLVCDEAGSLGKETVDCNHSCFVWLIEKVKLSR
jgi:hypothetical protein